jgi:hypothetical protein
MRVKLDTLDEVREVQRIRKASAKARAARRYNTCLVPRAFKVGVLLLRKADGPRKITQHVKLVAKWEGSFRVYNEVEKGAYMM